jgi:hypothetical protein
VLAFHNALFLDNAGDILATNSSRTRFEHCTFHNNASNMTAMGLAALTVRNSVFWGNRMALGTALGGTIRVDYTDIDTALPPPPGGGGAGNLSTDPLFAGAARGDFHLQPASPCIDAGDTNSPFGNEPFPNGRRVNMGRYGNTPEAESWRQGVPVAAVGLQTGQLRLGCAAASNAWYGIEFSPDLSCAWTNAATNRATGDAMEVAVPLRGRQGFYRVYTYRP